MSTPNADAEGGGADTSAVEDFDLPLTDDDGNADESEGEENDAPLVAAKPAKKAEEPAAAEAATDEDELESLRKKREERKARLEAERAKVDASGRVKELEQKLSKLDTAESLVKGGKKLEAIKQLGLTLDELISEHVESMDEGAEQGVAPTAQDKALLKRLETLEAQLKAKEDAEKAAADAAKEQERQRQSQAGYQGAVNKAKALLEAGGEKFEVINATGAHEAVYQEFSKYCIDNQLSFTADEEDEAVAMFTAFAARSDEILAERYAAASRTKKVQSRLGGKSGAAHTPKAEAKTAARGGHVAPPVTTDDDFEDVIDPRQRARLLSGRFKLSEQ